MNNDHHNTKNNGFDNDYHPRTLPAPTQVYDEIHDDQVEEQIPQSPHQQQLISPSIQV
jgi:hypothetical protein